MAMKTLEPPVPPPSHFRYPGHHWLMWDPANHGSGGMPEYQVMQWNPVSKKWVHSNQIATARVIERLMEGWTYHSHIELPG